MPLGTSNPGSIGRRKNRNSYIVKAAFGLAAATALWFTYDNVSSQPAKESTHVDSAGAGHNYTNGILMGDGNEFQGGFKTIIYNITNINNYCSDSNTSVKQITSGATDTIDNVVNDSTKNNVPSGEYQGKGDDPARTSSYEKNTAPSAQKNLPTSDSTPNYQDSTKGVCTSTGTVRGDL